MRDIVHYTHQTLGRFAPAWNTARKRKSEIRIVLGAATRTGMGMGKIDDEGLDQTTGTGTEQRLSS